MDTPLLLLLVKDSQDDAILIARELRCSGYDLSYRRVDNAQDFSAALDEQDWDVIVADHVMPNFGALAALEILKQRQLDLPFIIVSGTIGKDAAVMAIKAGAHDYVMKDDLVRLGPAVRRELHEAQVRLALKSAEKALRESKVEHRLLLHSIWSPVLALKADMTILYCNQACAELLGRPVVELEGQGLLALFPQFEQASLYAACHQVLETQEPKAIEYELAGRHLHTWIYPTPWGVLTLAEDMTERRQREEEIHKQAVQLEALRQVGLEITAQLDLDVLLRSIVLRAIEMIKGTTGGFYLYQPERDLLEWSVPVGLDLAPVGAVLQRGQGVCGKVWETGDPLIVGDYQHWAGRADVWNGYPIAASIGVPVRWGDEFLGVLNVLAPAPRVFDASDAELLSLLSTQAAIAIRNARLYEQVRSRVERLAAVNRVTKAVGGILHLDDLLEAVYQEITAIFQADAFSIALYDPETSILDFRILVDKGEREQPRRHPLGSGLCSLIVAWQKPLLIHNLEQDQARLPDLELWGTMEIPASWLGVPMQIAGRLIGLISVQAYQPFAYGEEDQLLLSTIADQAAVAIESARLYEETQRRAMEQETVGRIARALNALDVREAFPVLVKGLQSLITCDRVTLAVLEKDGAHFRMVNLETESLPPNMVSGSVLPLSVSSAFPDMTAGRIHFTPDLANEKEYVVEQSLYQAGYRSRINLPLVVAGQSLGLLNLVSRQTGAFWQAKLPVLEQVADAVAVAIENSRLFQAERQQRELAQALEAAAAALTGTLDFEQVLDRILEQVGRVIPGDAVNIMLIEDGRARIVRWRGYERFGAAEFITTVRFCIAEVPDLQYMLDTGESRVVPDTTHSPDWVQMHPQAWLRSCAAAPVIVRGQVIGFLNIDSATAGFFSEAHLGPLRTFADHAAAAIENARLFQSEQQQARRLALLADVARTVVTNLDAAALLQAVADSIRHHFGYPMVGICTVDARAKLLTLKGYSGVAVEPATAITTRAYQQSIEQGILGHVVRTAKSYIAPDVTQDPYFVSAGENLIRSTLSVPILGEGQVIGVIGLTSDQMGAFDAQDQSSLEAVADTVALGLRNARLYRKARLHADELADALVKVAGLDRLKDEFLQNVSHELRTPLALILGYSEMLQSGDMGELHSEQLEPIRVIAQRARALSDLVDDFTAVLDAESQQLWRGPINLAAIIAPALDDYRAAAQQAGLTLMVEIAPDLPTMLGNPPHLQRVLDNLVDNALKFTPEGGQVIVRLWVEGENVVLEVSDNGIGIPEHALDRIFDRFYQVDGSTTRRYGGTGLGLALVKEIVQAHDGRVSVQSIVGEGTTFRVLLPIETEPE